MITRRGVLAGGLAATAAAITPGYARATPALQFRWLADGVYMHTSWIAAPHGAIPSNGLVVVSGDEALIADTAIGKTQTEDMLDHLIGHPNRRLAITHGHGDRMSGIAATKARGIWSMAHRRTANMPYAVGQGGVDAVWDGQEITLDVGGRRVVWFYPGPAHSPDNTVLYVEDCNLLYGACLVRALDRTSLGGTASADVCHWPLALRALRQRFPHSRLVVPGHGDPGDARLLDHTLRLAEAALHPIKSVAPD